MRYISLKNPLVILAFAVVLVIIGSILIAENTKQADASVTRFAEYNATSTRSMVGPISNLQVITPTTTPTAGTLGSVVITGAAAGMINLYDATTSDITQRAASMSTTSILLTTFPNSAAAGTYTFDTLFRNGLMVELTGTAPSSTITYRLN